MQESRLARGRRRRSPALAETRSRPIAEYERRPARRAGQGRAEGASLAQELIKAEQRTRLQMLTAPVDGVVQQLAVHTIGGVVTPAQAAAWSIVPADSQLEIEAMISNRDIGFVEAGQDGGDQGRHLQLHPLRAVAGHGAQRVARRHHARQAAGQGEADKPQGARGRQQRAQGPGAGLCRARVARPHAHAGRGQDW